MGRKLRAQKGFTLIEVLLVVAVIVILLALAIPAVMGAVNDARHRADAKYERAALARANSLLGMGEVKDTCEYVFDPENGALIERESGSFKIEDHIEQPYGNCRKHGHTDKYLLLKVDGRARTVQVTWGTKFGGTGGGYVDNLCDP